MKYLLLTILYLVWFTNFAQSVETTIVTNVTTNYYPASMPDPSSGRVNILPCAGSPWSETNPFRPGMFLFDGDFQGWVGQTTGTLQQCVSTEPNKTHEMAPLQVANCLSSAWKVSHGTPEICSQDNNRFIHLWAGNWTTDNDFEGEGIFYDCPLIFCAYYDIKLKLKSFGTIKKVRFLLAQGLTHRPVNANAFQPESDFYKVPLVSQLQVLYELNNFNSSSWLDITIPTFTPFNDNMKLWIVIEDDKTNVQNAGADILFIDEVTDGLPGSNSTCSGNLTFTSSPLPPYSKANTITASQSTTVSSGQSVEFVAGASVSLLNGFSALSGSNFRAYIIPCAFSNNCPANNIQLRTRGSDDTAAEVVEKKSELPGITIYPNPTGGKVTVKAIFEQLSKTVSFEIVNANGLVVLVKKYENLKSIDEQFDLSSFPSGVYVIRIQNESGVATQKIIKI